MKNNLVTIIVPVYNTFCFLDKCINSLINQSYTDLEILLINDGSTDNSLEKCNYYSKLDPRVKVIDKFNEGIAEARNDGLNIANGEYILFIDSDDYVESDIVKDSIEFIENNNLDSVVYGIVIDYLEESYSTYNCLNEKLYSKSLEEYREILIKLFDNGLLHSPCNKLYKRKIIENINLRFKKGSEPIEDIVFNCTYLKNIEKIGVINKAYYHYIKLNRESAVTKYRDNLWELSEERSSSIRSLFESKFLGKQDEIKELLSKEYLGGKSDCISNMYRKNNQLSFNDRRRYIDRYILKDEQLKNIIKYLDKDKLPFDQKILYLLAKLNNSLIVVLIYNMLFLIRYNFFGIYKNIRKQGNLKNEN